MTFQELLNNNTYVILDGGMGTQLQAAGLKLGQRPETLCFSDPEVVAGVHRRYIEAGSHMVYTNTFQANAHKLEGTGYTPAEVITQAVKVARMATEGTDTLVAVDCGPIGEMLEPLGTLKFDDAYELFKEVAVAGEKAGADLIIFETFTDLYEMKAAVLAAKENTNLTVMSTISFEQNGRTFTGTTVPSMALTLEGLGVDAIGINCSLGPKEIYSLAKQLCAWTSLPIIIKPNAGLPDPKTNTFTISPEEFAKELVPYATELGIRIFGGCCGTTPDFIRSTVDALKNVTPAARNKRIRHGVCSASQVAELNGVRAIGERINPTGKKRFQQALKEHDISYILERGIEQQDAGADILDVNVGLPGVDEPQMMADVVKALQSVIPLPLQIDSSEVAAIEAGLRYVNGKPIVNSVNGKEEVLHKILPLVKKYGASVVGLTMDEKGIPQTCEERFEIAKRILDAALSYGIPKQDVFIDCLTLTVSAQQAQAAETLKAVRRVTEELGLHTVLGVSNISFGLPDRIRITESFLIQAMHCGLDLPIINPNQLQIMDAISTFRVLSGEDVDSMTYIDRFSNRPKEVLVPVSSLGANGTAGASGNGSGAGASAGSANGAAGSVTGNAAAATGSGKFDKTPEEAIQIAVSKGLKDECARLTKELLKDHSEIDIINGMLIPALDVVGTRYEKGELFLPQLINAANASCAAFDVIKDVILERGSESVSKGKIMVATVQGDIHDIGKNIVKVILENYGYQVIDLGRDVPVEQVVEQAIAQDVHLIGLSALMTTTVASMAQTIKALHKSGHPCKIWVGGAVLTPEYAKEIGADFYAKDAKQSVDIAKEVLG